jgi:hypothetical protein
MKKRWRNKNLRQEMSEIDYWDKLDAKERAYLTQFLHEYYQGDFNWDKTIHPASFKKEGMQRDNAQRRQITSIGQDLLQQAVDNIRGKANPRSSRYYLPEDWIKDHDITEENDEY